MRILTLLCCFLCLLSCEEEHRCEGDPFELFLFIEIVDSSGNNLITNNTFNINEVIVWYGGYENKNPVLESLLDKENLIVINIHGNDGDNTFEIELSNAITDILVMNISNEVTNPPCSMTISTLNSVFYNGTNQTLKDFEGHLITIVK